MAKQTTTPTPKQPATIRVRTLVPWVIVGTFVAGSIGLMAGWFLHVDLTYDARQSLVIVESKAQK